MVFHLIRTNSDFGYHHLNIDADEVLEILYKTPLALKIATETFKLNNNSKGVKLASDEIDNLLFLSHFRLYYTDAEDCTLVHVQCRTKSFDHLFKALIEYKYED